MLTPTLASLLLVAIAEPKPPIVAVSRDDTRIEHSCVIRIAPGTVIADANGDGVIQIAADNIAVEFEAGSSLNGAPAEKPGDEFTGIGIRLDGHKGVTIKNAGVHGFKVGVLASHANGLVVDGGDLSGNYHQHLRSTPAAEDGADWLFPHNNDHTKWREQYGAALCVEESDGVTIRAVRVRQGQNGIIIDRVNDSKVYDNDCSFLSGWGLAMWRSNRNVISRNAFDFCVRGYSHKVYNRGQDSAGILMFEQNNANVLAENSATHGGDCFFGFAGNDALGQEWLDAERTRLRKETGKDDVEALIKAPSEVVARFKRRGNSDNLLIDNDLSYAPAHGIEMTFSFGNRFIGNRMVENAICGVWGGYSQDTLIAGNTFEGNGEMAYGMERGGINIEHGAGNQVLNNTFKNNKCGVHLWWDEDAGLLRTPWAIANSRPAGGRLTASIENTIAENSFEGDLVAVQLREDSGTTLVRNTMTGVKKERDVTGGTAPSERSDIAISWARPKVEVLGSTHPVGARAALRGRQNIVMTEWGPWDHETPLVRLTESSGTTHAYELHNLSAGEVTTVGPGLRVETVPSRGEGVPTVLRVTAAGSGVHAYKLIVKHPGYERVIAGTILATTWDVTLFRWTKETDPREKLDAWRALAKGPTAVAIQSGTLSFKYGGGGPGDLGLGEAVTKADLGRDHFGMIARTTVPLPKGKWRIKTQSDDGVRVTVDGKPVVDNWTWHGPTPNQGEFELHSDKTVEIIAEHFEIDGFAVMELELQPVEP